MKKFLAILVLGLFLITPSQADDSRDFQIEGMSIGDSLLDYFSEEEILENLPYSEWKKKKFNLFEFNSSERFEDYDAIQISFKRKDKKYIIYSIEGLMNFQDNIDNCIKKMKEIDLELSKMFKNLEKEEFGFAKLRQDKSGKSKYTTTMYYFSNEDRIGTQCYDWSKEIKGIDHLRVLMRKKEYSKWLISDDPY